MPGPLTQLGKEYAVAPRDHEEWLSVTINADSAENITANMPDQAALGESPMFDLLLALNTAAQNSGLIGVCVTDDAAVQDITHPYVGPLEDFDGILVPGLRPLGANGTDLDVPLPWVTVQRVYIVNLTGGQVTLDYGVRKPTLAWE